MAKTKRFNLINILSKISAIAEKSKWIKSYDKQLDYFCWTRPQISKNTALVKISNEMLLYINSNGVVEGIGVEYLLNNFIQHNPEYKKVPNFFTKKISGGLFTVPEKKDRATKETFYNLTEDLVNDVYEESFKNNKTANDIEGLIGAAIN